MLRCLTRCLLGACLALVATSAPCRAQCEVDRSSGCPGVAAPTCVGEPRVGKVVTVRCPGCQGIPFVLLGLCLPANIVLPSPPLCVRNCRLGSQPLVVVPADAISIRIPDFVGLAFCVQCGCAELQNDCVRLAPTMKITIQSP